VTPSSIRYTHPNRGVAIKEALGRGVLRKARKELTVSETDGAMTSAIDVDEAAGGPMLRLLLRVVDTFTEKEFTTTTDAATTYQA
jgi:hypothetical protein